MELKLDLSKEYALALEGGGAKGAYQIGAWRALREAGVRIRAVSGSSVGALNGAMIVMGDVKKAEEVWANIRYSQVLDVDDETMHNLLNGKLLKLDLRSALETVQDVVRNRGLDITPLSNWIREVVDEPTVRASDMELYIVTYSLEQQKELELRARDIPEGQLHEMLLASSYLPFFHNERLAGKYADGGVRDVLPLHVLLENGYKDIIALRLYGIGLERRTKIPKDVKLYTVAPTVELGGVLDFNAAQSRANLTAGYFDAQRLLYGLRGRDWYIDAQWDEERAYAYLAAQLRRCAAAEGKTPTLRALHETLLPRLARALDEREGDYRDLAHALLESAGAEAGLERWHIYTEDALAEALGGDFASEALRTAVKRPGALARLRGKK